MGEKNNSIALNENNSNEKPLAGAMAIQIMLATDTCLLNIAYRISVTAFCKTLGGSARLAADPANFC